MAQTKYPRFHRLVSPFILPTDVPVRFILPTDVPVRFILELFLTNPARCVTIWESGLPPFLSRNKDMKRIAVLLALLTIAVAACWEEPPPPPPPEVKAPPPPSPEEIAAEIRQVIQPLQALTVAARPGQGWGSGGTGATGMLTKPIEKQVVDGLRAARAKHQVTENGKIAITMVAHEITDIIKIGRDQERWRLVLGCIRAYKALEPTSIKMDTLMKRAELHERRPTVRIKGFFDDKETGDTYVFLEVMERPSRKLHKVEVRVGDEFHNVKLVGFVGNKRGVELEYLLIEGHTWEVLGP